jgi:hypothetical protein
MRPILAASAFLLTVAQLSSALGEKVWLQPDCPVAAVQGFNEARFVAGLMRDELNGAGNPAIDEDLMRWFNITTLQGGYVKEVVDRYNKIASLVRTFDRAEAAIVIECDNQAQWKLQWPSDAPPEMKDYPVPPTWSVDDEFGWDTYIFRHEILDTHLEGSSLGCRSLPHGSRPLAGTVSRKNNRNGNTLGDGSLSPVLIDLCLDAFKVTARTSDIAARDLTATEESMGVRGTLQTIAYTLIHEFIHVPVIGGGTIDGHTVLTPPDNHPGSVPGSFVSGRVDGQNPYSGRFEFIGTRLQDPWKTIHNPDSYAFFAKITRMRHMGWDMTLDFLNYRPAYQMRWMFNPEGAGADVSKWVDGVWTEPEWETNLPPNWTDDITPRL